MVAIIVSFSVGLNIIVDPYLNRSTMKIGDQDYTKTTDSYETSVLFFYILSETTYIFSELEHPLKTCSGQFSVTWDPQHSLQLLETLVQTWIL